MQTSTRTGLPAWADEAILSGEPNTYFDAKEQARGLSAAQKKGLPSLIKAVEERLEGPDDDAQRNLAEALVKIAVRVQPGIPETNGLAWAAEMVASFSRTPVDLLARAVDAARHRQFQFLNEVGPFLASEIDEPLRQRNIKLNRLREIQLAASALPAPSAGYATPEQAAEIMATFKIHDRAAKAAKPADSAPIDWNVEDSRRLADSNFLRAMQGLPAQTLDEYRAARTKSLRRSINHGVDPLEQQDDGEFDPFAGEA